MEKDVKYMSMYYPTVDQVYDEGALTLVFEPFMKWVKATVTSINLQINKDKIRRKKNSIMNEATKIIMNNGKIYKIFKEAMVVKPGIEEKVVSTRHLQIHLKTIHARANCAFKNFHDGCIGHYSTMINVELRKSLQVTTKHSKRKTDHRFNF